VPTILGEGAGDDKVYAVALSADGRLLASADGGAGTIRMWSALEPPTRVSPLRYRGTDTSQLVSVAVSSDGGMVAAGTADPSDGDNALLVWRLSDRSPGMKAAAQSPVRSLAFSTDARFLAATTEADTDLVIWSVEPSQLSSRLVALPTQAVGACFVPNEYRLMLALKDGSLHTWTSTGTSVDRSSVLTRDAGPVTAIACAGESGNIGTGDQTGRVALWDRNGRSILQLRGQNTRVTAIGTDKRATIVVTSDEKGNIRVWTVAKPNDPPVVVPSTLAHVASLAVDPSAEWVVAAGDDKVLKIDLTATLLRKAEARMWRNLSLDEWRRFVGDMLPPRPTFSRLPPPR
jgi:FOG: WD40 repeat